LISRYLISLAHILMTIDAEYTNEAGKTLRFSTSYFKDSLDVLGWSDTKEHKLSLFAVDRAGNRSKSLELKCTPLEPVVSRVGSLLKAMPASGSFFVEWKNELEQEINIYVEITFTEKGAKRSILSIYTSMEPEERVYLRDMKPDAGTKIEVQARIEDTYGNISNPVDFGDFELLTDEFIPKSDWTLPEANDSARFDTIGGKIGYERVEIDLISAGRIPASEIFMGKATTTLIEFNNANHRDTTIVIDSLCSWVNIKGLTAAKMYRFYIYTLDKYGNRSVPQEIALIPYTAADKAQLSLRSPNISVMPSSVTMDWSGDLSSVQGDYVGLTYHYTDADGNEKEGSNSGTTPHIFAPNLPIGASYSVTIDFRIIPKIEGKRIIDTVTVTTTVDFVLSDASTAFVPKEREVLEQNGVTNFTAEGVASISKLYFPVHVKTLEDVIYFAGLREVDLTGGSIYLLPITIRSLNADDRFVIRDSTIYLRFSKMRNLIIIKSQQITNFTDPSQLSYYPRGSYYEFVTTGGDPNINTSPLTESFIDVMTPVRKIVIAFEYQTEKSIGTMEFFYGRPNAVGGESSGGQLMLTRTGGGLDESDNTKWNDFIHDMTFAYSNWGWGAVGHRLRFDIAVTAGHRVFVRNMRYMVVEGDID